MVSQFQWIVPGRLAGSGQPGLMRSAEEDWSFLHDAGVRLVVTLTENPLDPPPDAFGIQGLHFPISDMGIPATPRHVNRLCDTILAAMDEGLPVLVHCKAGIGRTGTILACCLVALGRRPQEALVEVRRSNPAYIQTESQERFVVHYGAFLELQARHGDTAEPEASGRPFRPPRIGR